MSHFDEVLRRQPDVKNLLHSSSLGTETIVFLLGLRSECEYTGEKRTRALLWRII